MIVCFDCDTVQQLDKLERGFCMRCICCNGRLLMNPKGGLDTPLALIVSAIIFFIIANSYPLMTMGISGLSHTTMLFGVALGFVDENQLGLALLVGMTIIIAPLLIILAMFYVLVSVRFKLRLPLTKMALVWIVRLQPWGMMDVFLLGAIVAFIKLTGQSDVIFGIGFYALSALIISYAGAIVTFEPYLVWEYLDEHQ